MSTKTIQITIESLSPILMNRFPEEPIPGLDKKTKDEQAEVAAYRIPQSHHLYVPGVAVQRALINGAVYCKGKGRASLQKIAAACLMVTPEYLDLGSKNYVIDSRPVVNPTTKGRIMKHRPKLERWSITFQLEYDETLLSKDQLREIVDLTGKRVGLLDFRPERKGMFGRFIVTKWQSL